ncbi:hypothetical protein POM88_013109 [Heracleum sosnowskyi]|uniref:F-box protein n=1 Tax=Heracleum sosnowskyi TaxID=360622 RepID=A0AAD8N413_9APIA|nr:hypothetical protein POM88_013109 [Heracleum sosnowskyi]
MRCIASAVPTYCHYCFCVCNLRLPTEPSMYITSSWQTPVVSSLISDSEAVSARLTHVPQCFHRRQNLTVGIDFSDQYRDIKRARLLVDGSGIEIGCWGLLDGLVLARVFHSLRADLKSLVRAALTCKHWRSVSKVYRDICIQADLSSVAPNCTDTMISSILEGYNKKKYFTGSTWLHKYYCGFPSINWVSGRVLHSRMRTLEDINKRTSVFKISDDIGSQYEDSSVLKHYLENLSVRDRANQFFRGSLYKRSKLFDARRSSSILSRGAHLRRQVIIKSDKEYKVEEFLTSSLKIIMKENTFDFFEPRITEITCRMENGYYTGHGLSSIKEDIIRMCRDAMKKRIEF